MFWELVLRVEYALTAICSKKILPAKRSRELLRSPLELAKSLDATEVSSTSQQDHGSIYACCYHRPCSHLRKRSRHWSVRCPIAPALHDFLAPSNRQLHVSLNLNLNYQTATLTGHPQHTNNSVAWKTTATCSNR